MGNEGGSFMRVQAEVSLYPLRDEDPAAPIFTFVRRLERPGLTLEVGALSCLVTGESEPLFEALREAYEEACRTGRRALVIKLLN